MSLIYNPLFLHFLQKWPIFAISSRRFPPNARGAVEPAFAGKSSGSWIPASAVFPAGPRPVTFLRRLPIYSGGSAWDLHPTSFFSSSPEFGRSTCNISGKLYPGRERNARKTFSPCRREAGAWSEGRAEGGVHLLNKNFPSKISVLCYNIQVSRSFQMLLEGAASGPDFAAAGAGVFFQHVL